MTAIDFGVNVIGFISGKLGLGVAARATIASLVQCGVPVAGVDIILSEGRSNADMTWNHLCVGPGPDGRLPHAVNIVHVNPVEAASLKTNYPAFFESSYNIIVPFWELSRVPQSWIPLLAEYDLVLAASSHISAAMTKVSSTPVRPYRMGIQAKLPPAIDGRARFSLPRDHFIFAMSFDTNSGLSRKNSIGAIRAFDLAFEGRPDVSLMVKVNGATRSPELTALLERLGRSPRHHVITDYLSYADVLGLYDACDAYLSLHRAEGLGYGMMEAMALGKPVIATGWSGNMDFMDETNSCPVRFTLTPVVERNPEYDPIRVGEPCLWAEPDLHHAITLMRRVRNDVEYRERISAEARRSIEERNNAFLKGRYVKEIIESYLSYRWERNASLAGELLLV
jgi:hypothetical protein